jgi:CDP-diacylglycerol--serine O-phosphatidyltransferase
MQTGAVPIRIQETSGAVRKIAVLPTLLTLGNAVCGFASIALASSIKSDDPNTDYLYLVSAVLIFGAMIFDALDGYAARLSRSVSDFGKELDSLCDAISFGVAPAFLLLCIGQDWAGKVHARQVIAIIAGLYMVCAILRLARYNVESSPDPNAGKRFKGLPSPAAAGCVATLGLLRSGWGGVELNSLSPQSLNWYVSALAPLGTLAVALLMVSSIPYPHLIKYLTQRRRRHFGVVVQAVLIVFVIALTRGLALAALFWAYALAFPLRSMLVRRPRPVAPTDDHDLDWMEERKVAKE